MKLLELFSGSGILSKTFRDNGHDTFTIDFNKKYNPDLCKDIIDLSLSDIPFKPDVIWASPPCQCFSIASCSSHWNNHIPIDDDTIKSILLVYKTILLIKTLNPKYYFIENPMGLLRTMEFMRKLPRKTVTYCQYGDNRMKPTDIFTNCNKWIPKPMCKNGDKCHESAPRGSKTGTQGLINDYERSKLPEQLCIDIMNSCNGSKTIQKKIN